MGLWKRPEPPAFPPENTLGVNDSQILSDKTARSLEAPPPPPQPARKRTHRTRRLLPIALLFALAATIAWRWHAWRAPSSSVAPTVGPSSTANAQTSPS